MEEIGPRIRLYGEALAFVKGKERLSWRNQAKTFWRLCRFYGVAEVGYVRMRELLLLGEAPLGKEEEALVALWKEYRLDLERPIPLAVPGPDTELSAVVRAALESAHGLGPLPFFGALNGALVCFGLWPIRLTNAEKGIADSILGSDAETATRALLRTPMQDEFYLAALKPLTQADVIGWVRAKVLADPRVARAFLMGSFFYGGQTLESDIDLGVVFAEGLNEEEKSAVLSDIRDGCLRSLLRTADVKELLTVEEGAPPTIPDGEGTLEVFSND